MLALSWTKGLICEEHRSILIHRNCKNEIQPAVTPSGRRPCYGLKNSRTKLIFCHCFRMVLTIDPRGITKMVLSGIWAQSQVLIFIYQCSLLSSVLCWSCFAYTKSDFLSYLSYLLWRTWVQEIRTVSEFLISLMVFLESQEWGARNSPFSPSFLLLTIQ